MDNTYEKIIGEKLEDIKQNKNKKDAISFIQTEIGKYRLEAEKHSGFIRYTIHKTANDLEDRLNLALKNSIAK